VSARAVLFDLDDTLIDYGGAVAACWDAACARAAAIGADPAVVAAAVHEARAWFWGDPERHRRERVDMLGAWTKIAALALERAGRPSDVGARAIATDFAARRMATTTLFPDAVPCLEALRERGVALGCVTNGDAAMQRDKLARFALGPFFEVVVVEGEFGAGKPDAVVYRHALRSLGVAPADAIMVGDNLEWDVAGARAVGLAGVWIDRAGSGLPPDAPVRPTRTIRSLAELVPSRQAGSVVASSAAGAGRATSQATPIDKA
jgi:putative hydrolase of the HAD superfamily